MAIANILMINYNRDMPNLLTQTERDVILVHALFGILCGVVLLIPFHLAIGMRIFILVAVYNLLIPFLGFWRKDRQVLELWAFCLVLSMFQVFPDWFLSAQLGVLVFPADGFPRIGAVSGYMAGLWTIPMFMIIFFGQSIQARFSKTAALFAVGLASLAVFGGSEAIMWALPSWYARNVHMIGHVAYYILIPEVLLGVSGYLCHAFVSTRGLTAHIAGAFGIMTFYLGNAAWFYFFFERILWGG